MAHMRPQNQLTVRKDYHRRHFIQRVLSVKFVKATIVQQEHCSILKSTKAHNYSIEIVKTKTIHLFKSMPTFVVDRSIVTACPTVKSFDNGFILKSVF